MFLFFRLFAGGFFFGLVFRLALVAIIALTQGGVVAVISNENAEQGLGQLMEQRRE
jgi:hypothetical protein